MRQNTAVRVKPISRPFKTCVKLLRKALTSEGLTVVKDIDLSRSLGNQFEEKTRRCAVLMVDTPSLLFASVALERSAAAFIPLHIAITGDQHLTCIHWAHPTAALGLRLSPAVCGAVDALYVRVSHVIGKMD